MNKIPLDDDDRDDWNRLAKLVEEKFTSTNTGSPKFIGLAELDREMLINYGVLSDIERLTMNRVYTIIANKLRASA